MPELLNAAGEKERDACSRRANLVEAWAVFAVLELAMWGLIGGLGATPDGEGATGRRARVLGHGVLGVVLLYIAFGAARLHGDSAGDRGLAAPRANVRALRAWYRRAPRSLAATLAILGLALCIAAWRGWPNLLARLGMRRHFPETFDALLLPPARSWAPVAAALGLLLPLSVLAIRWDTAASALRRLAPPAVLVWAATLALAAGYAVLSGDAARLQPHRWLAIHPDRTAGVFYLLWAFVQQYLLLAYFCTRLRRAVPPGGVLGVPGRAWVAAACGAIFGLLHLPALHLVAAAGVLGAVLAWYFQEDRCRNLFFVALIHAGAGTLYSWLLPLSMRFGPWAG